MRKKAQLTQPQWDALRELYITGGDDVSYESLAASVDVNTNYVRQVAAEEKPTWHEQRAIWRKHQTLAATIADAPTATRPKKARKRKGVPEIEPEAAEAELNKQQRLRIKDIAANSAAILETVEQSVQQLIDPTTMINTHIAIARLLQAKLVKRLRSLDPEEISIRDLPVLLKTAVDIERLSLGMATDLKIVGGIGPVDQTPTKIEIIPGQLPPSPDCDRPLKFADPTDALAESLDQQLTPTQVEIAIRADVVDG